MQAHLPALQVVVPLFGALLARARAAAGCRLGWSPPSSASLSPVIAVLLAPSGADRAASISYHLGGWDPSLGIEYRVDVVNGADPGPRLRHRRGDRALRPPERRRRDRGRTGSPGSTRCISWRSTGLLGIAITGDAFNAFVFLEISSLSSYALIASAATAAPSSPPTST